MWRMYLEIIDSIPSDIEVYKINQGSVWTLVYARSSQRNYCGVAVTINEQNEPLQTGQEFLGKKLKDLALESMSWNYRIASIGAASVNAYVNAPSTIEKLAPSYEIKKSFNTFSEYGETTKDKNVAVIGHFYFLEKYLKDAKNVKILERRPRPGDLPAAACEYVLPDQDFTFMTGSTFVNKTMQRLLELSKDNTAIVVGPSTPMHPTLFNYGADQLAGLMIEDISDDLLDDVANGIVKLYDVGQRITIVPKK